MFYDFVCDQCGAVQTVRAKITEGPVAPICWNAFVGVSDFYDNDCPMTQAAHGPMRRIYAQPQEAIVVLDSVDYHEKAYRGEEKVPGLSLSAVRGMIDNDVRHSRRGRANERHYKTLR